MYLVKLRLKGKTGSFVLSPSEYDMVWRKAKESKEIEIISHLRLDTFAATANEIRQREN